MKVILHTAPILLLLFMFIAPVSDLMAQSASDSVHQTSAPLYNHPIYDDAPDPVLLWNREEHSWWMLYSTRRANLPTVDVSAYFGDRIGITSSSDHGQTFPTGMCPLISGFLAVTRFYLKFFYPVNIQQLFSSLLFFSLGLVSCQPTPSSNEAAEVSVDSTFTNPLLANGADPWAIFHEGNYYYIKSEDGSLLLMRTPDITDLRNAQTKTIWTPPPGTDHSENVWAPEIHFINDNWYVYVAADDGDNRNHRMFALENTAADPFQGSFELKAKIRTDANDNWAIDGSVFEHRDSLYFIWSGWEKPKVDMETQRIYIARMSNPWTISSERVVLSEPELEWERNWDYPDAWTPEFPVYVNEGPQMLKHGSKLHIIYSASGCWTPYYALGRLTTDQNSNLMDSEAWEKSPEPVFQQSPENKVYGTGHNSFFQSPDGSEDWILYHANDDPADGCGGKRSPRAQQITWTQDDIPIFGEPVPTSQPLKKPSGTPLK